MAPSFQDTGKRVADQLTDRVIPIVVRRSHVAPQQSGQVVCELLVQRRIEVVRRFERFAGLGWQDALIGKGATRRGVHHQKGKHNYQQQRRNCCPADASGRIAAKRCSD